MLEIFRVYSFLPRIFFLDICEMFRRYLWEHSLGILFVVGIFVEDVCDSLETGKRIVLKAIQSATPALVETCFLFSLLFFPFRFAIQSLIEAMFQSYFLFLLQT